MQLLSKSEIHSISAGKHKPSVFNVVAASVFGGVCSAAVGLVTGGPAGAIAGFGVGAYEGAATALTYEAGMALADLD